MEPTQITPPTTPPRVGRRPKYATAEEKRQANLESGRRFREKAKAIKEVTNLLNEPGKEWLFVLKAIELACKGRVQFEESQENFQLLYDAAHKMKRVNQ
jgi:hypothetical protein